MPTLETPTLTERQKAENKRRAANGARAVAAYREQYDDEDEFTLTDLLTDLMHWAHQEHGHAGAYEFAEQSAWNHFYAEINGED